MFDHLDHPYFGLVASYDPHRLDFLVMGYEYAIWFNDSRLGVDHGGIPTLAPLGLFDRAVERKDFLRRSLYSLLIAARNPTWPYDLHLVSLLIRPDPPTGTMMTRDPLTTGGWPEHPAQVHRRASDRR
ncbi:MAG: hypothetical protein GTO17_08470 [Candidatus Aminicenantes bacterium]|nr:hypothetical protein [Candidatus Aminicenantes bacterium]